ncbi:hypothetical protein [uncultured Thiodictyon sp.]|jgi:hypothetical protein|uniref:hypothetical protein n=1 Tax=uncultured Thiodictyon sp. TaxID=1846217 RepID=UPI0025ECF46B|nr:hypothetical protein [uncultured Thiodictyon sp.]
MKLGQGPVSNWSSIGVLCLSIAIALSLLIGSFNSGTPAAARQASDGPHRPVARVCYDGSAQIIDDGPGGRCGCRGAGYRASDAKSPVVTDRPLSFTRVRVSGTVLSLVRGKATELVPLRVSSGVLRQLGVLQLRMDVTHG